MAYRSSRLQTRAAPRTGPSLSSRIFSFARLRIARGLRLHAPPPSRASPEPCDNDTCSTKSQCSSCGLLRRRRSADARLELLEESNNTNVTDNCAACNEDDSDSDAGWEKDNFIYYDFLAEMERPGGIRSASVPPTPLSNSSPHSDMLKSCRIDRNCQYDGSQDQNSTFSHRNPSGSSIHQNSNDLPQNIHHDGTATLHHDISDLNIDDLESDITLRLRRRTFHDVRSGNHSCHLLSRITCFPQPVHHERTTQTTSTGELELQEGYVFLGSDTIVRKGDLPNGLTGLPIYGQSSQELTNALEDEAIPFYGSYYPSNEDAHEPTTTLENSHQNILGDGRIATKTRSDGFRTVFYGKNYPVVEYSPNNTIISLDEGGSLTSSGGCTVMSNDPHQHTTTFGENDNNGGIESNTDNHPNNENENTNLSTDTDHETIDNQTSLFCGPKMSPTAENENDID
ncbi:MAG: hypothetical protein M1834_006068 [Cirrosporium novae-zelandiae]|nr:MAG: hypothetical protein M1834_006068 [Cirrosporium novae-zelandiae]